MGAATAAIVVATTAHLLWVVIVVVAAAAINCVYSLAAAGYCRGRGMYQYWVSSYHRHRAHYFIIPVVILVPGAVTAAATVSFVVIEVTVLILLVVVGEIKRVISGKIKNTRESLIKLIFNSNLLFIVRSYHNHQHHAIIVGGGCI